MDWHFLCFVQVYECWGNLCILFLGAAIFDSIIYVLFFFLLYQKTKKVGVDSSPTIKDLIRINSDRSMKNSFKTLIFSFQTT